VRSLVFGSETCLASDQEWHCSSSVCTYHEGLQESDFSFGKLSSLFASCYLVFQRLDLALQRPQCSLSFQERFINTRELSFTTPKDGYVGAMLFKQACVR